MAQGDLVHDGPGLPLVDTDRQGSLAGSATRLTKLWDRLMSPKGFSLDQFRSFDVSTVRTDDQSRIVEALRKRKYSTNVGLEDADFLPHTEVFLCHAADGTPVASLRFAYQLAGVGDLTSEKLFKIPQRWIYRSDGSLANLSEGIRFCNAGRNTREQVYAKMKLWATVYWRCLDLGIDWNIALARHPINLDYRRMGYTGPSPGGLWVTPQDYPVAHEVIALDIKKPDAPWKQEGHWLYAPANARPLSH